VLLEIPFAFPKNATLLCMSFGNMDPQTIADLPPGLLKTIPAAQPPPGIQPNFSNPETQVPAMLGVGIAFLALALICFTIRIYTKATISKNYRWDDGK
jgi:hypothetical protein